MLYLFYTTKKIPKSHVSIHILFFIADGSFAEVFAFCSMNKTLEK